MQMVVSSLLQTEWKQERNFPHPVKHYADLIFSVTAFHVLIAEQWSSGNDFYKKEKR